MVDGVAAGRGGSRASSARRCTRRALQVLARTGVRLDEPEAVELVRRAGATVDGDIVRLPAKLSRTRWPLLPVSSPSTTARAGRPSAGRLAHVLRPRFGLHAHRRPSQRRAARAGAAGCARGRDALRRPRAHRLRHVAVLAGRRAAADGRPPPDARDAQRHDQASHLRDLRHVRLRRRHRHGGSRRRRSGGAGRAAVPGLLHQHGQRPAAQP